MSPEPVTMYLSSAEMSQLSTDEDSFDCGRERERLVRARRNHLRHQTCIHIDACTTNTQIQLTWKMDAP